MAYADNKAATNHKAITAGAVALLQGAAILALINGLAVHFIPEAPKLPFEGRQIRLDPPPPPPPPPANDARKPADPVRDTAMTAPAVRDPLPATIGDPPVVPVGPVDTGPIVQPDTAGDPVPPVVQSVPARAARPKNDPAGWVGPSDYPYREQQEGHAGLVRVRLDIGSDGRVSGCRVIASSGFPGLDSATCATVSRRARFEPARDAEGRKIAGSYTGSIRWVIPD